MSDYTPRTIDEIQFQFFRQLNVQNAPLYDITPGSGIYTLGRSFAGMFAEAELNLWQLLSASNIARAKGADLDKLAANYGVLRKPGALAKGYTLVSSWQGKVELTDGTVLTDPKTALQFIMSYNTSQDLRAISDTRLNLTATRLGPESNLKAGTRLIAPGLEAATFVVGSHRTTGGQICGDLTGGAYPETDDELRSRLSDVLTNRRATTNSALIAAVLADGSVSYATTSVPLPGYLEVWVDSPNPLSQSDIARISSIVETHVAAGVLAKVRPLLRQELDINLLIAPKAGLDLDTLTAEIVGITRNYLLSLKLGQKMRRRELVAALMRPGNAIQVQVVTPETDINPDRPDAVLRERNIWVTFDAN